MNNNKLSKEINNNSSSDLNIDYSSDSENKLSDLQVNTSSSNNNSVNNISKIKLMTSSDDSSQLSNKDNLNKEKSPSNNISNLKFINSSGSYLQLSSESNNFLNKNSLIVQLFDKEITTGSKDELQRLDSNDWEPKAGSRQACGVPALDETNSIQSLDDIIHETLSDKLNDDTDDISYIITKNSSTSTEDIDDMEKDHMLSGTPPSCLDPAFGAQPLGPSLWSPQGLASPSFRALEKNIVKSPTIILLDTSDENNIKSINISNDIISDTNTKSSDSLINNVDKSSSNISNVSSISPIIQKTNMKSVGTNTEDLIMTLKIPFDSSKIIEAHNINIQGIINSQKNLTYPNQNFEIEKRNELEELKKNIIKRNEKKMQKIFEVLLDKHNTELEDEIFKTSMNIKLQDSATAGALATGLSAFQAKGQHRLASASPAFGAQPLEKISKKKSHIIRKSKISATESKGSKDLESDKSDSDKSDPFVMKYKFVDKTDITPKLNKHGKLILPEIHNLNSEEKRIFRDNRKKEILRQTKDNNKRQIINDINSDIDTSENSKKNNNSDNKNISEKEKQDAYDNRKKIRREKFLQHKKKKNIINIFFDMVYIISMKKDQGKIKPLLEEFKKNNVKYLISDGINAKNYRYLKYMNRWLYQKGDKDIKLNKQLFDYDIYIRKNPDLLKGQITNKTRAWTHWIRSGKKENRLLFEKTNIQNVYQLGCLLAHNKVIIDAIKKDYKKILILEDDIYLHKNFFDNFKKSMNKIPIHWDLLYFGAIQKKWNNINVNVDNNYYSANDTYGAFAYGLDKSVFNIIKNISLELVDPIDKCLQSIQKNSYVIYPNLIITNLEKSKIHRSRDITIYSKSFKWKLENYNIK